ncbi:MAG: DUF1232 domain-containing protein [archaeon]
MKKIAKKIKTEIKVYKGVLNDKRTPKLEKILLGAGIAYSLSPIDIIPDFIPILGYVDDIILVPLLIFIGLKFIPRKIIKKYRW